MSSQTLEQVVKRAFLEQYYPEDDCRTSDAQQVVEILGAYLKTREPDEVVLATEIFARHRIKVSEICAPAFGARFDALVIRSSAANVLIVRDYKVSAPRGISLDSACIAYSVAKCMLKQWSADYANSFEHVQLEYDFLGPNGLEGRTVLTREDVRLVWDDVKARTARIYSSADFPTVVGDHCGICPFQQTCERYSETEEPEPFD